MELEVQYHIPPQLTQGDGNFFFQEIIRLATVYCDHTDTRSSRGSAFHPFDVPYFIVRYYCYFNFIALLEYHADVIERATKCRSGGLQTDVWDART
jgi:hypothetical protein